MAVTELLLEKSQYSTAIGFDEQVLDNILKDYKLAKALDLEAHNV